MATPQPRWRYSGRARRRPGQAKETASRLWPFPRGLFLAEQLMGQHLQILIAPIIDPLRMEQSQEPVGQPYDLLECAITRQDLTFHGRFRHVQDGGRLVAIPERPRLA